MTDSEMRGLILKKYYAIRRTNRLMCFEDQELDGLDREEHERICEQLYDKGLLSWNANLSGVPGSGQITAEGVDVVEGTRPAPFSVVFHDRRVSVNSSNNVQIGDGNTISSNVDIGKILAAIDAAKASAAEKAEAKSLVSRITNNAAFAAALGALMTMLGASQTR